MIYYGYDKFEFSILEECSADELSEKELFWINYYQSFNKDKGYNLRIDSERGMETHPLTSEKISNRLKSEWRNGVRDSHSEKLKESWSRGDRDRVEQSVRMSENLTKYYYIVSDGNNTLILRYKELKEKNLHGVLSKFAKYKCDKVTFKGLIIERVLI